MVVWIAGHMIWLHLFIFVALMGFTAGCLLFGRNTLARASIKDVSGVGIRIVVGDLLTFGARRNALVAVGMNSAWDCELTTNGGSIAPGSLQGQVHFEMVWR